MALSGTSLFKSSPAQSPGFLLPLSSCATRYSFAHTIQAQSSTYYTGCERCSRVVTRALTPLISPGGSGPVLISVLPHSNEAEPIAFCYNCISCCPCYYLRRFPGRQACRTPRKHSSCKETTGTVSGGGHWESSPPSRLVDRQESSSQ